MTANPDRSSGAGVAAGHGLGRLGVRLALSFVGIALAAIAVLSVLTLLASRSEVAALVDRQQQQRSAEVAAALAQAYDDAGSWAGAELRPAYALAAVGGAELEVRDAAGRIVALPHAMAGMMARLHGTVPAAALGAPTAVAVTSNSERVGTAILRFPSSSLPASEREVRDALVRTVLIGSGLAALLALVVAAAVSRRITRPLVSLTAAVRRFEHGDRTVRAVTAGQGPGELGELAHAFDRMADTLAREDSLRRALVADVAHELRTPVTILRAYCEEMVDGVSEPTVERLVSLHDEVLRLGTIVDDLETLASAEAAGLRLERKPVGLERVAADAAEMLQPQFAAAELELLVELEPVEVEGDPGRLGQVVTNLLTNALKFTPRGGRVTLAVAPQGEIARLSVADTGPGIPPDELPHVFDRFWRGIGAAGIGGSGIGLAVVAELVHAHFGRVEASSTDGEGAVFTVLLPRSHG